MTHESFLWEFVGSVGAPIFAATLVGCLLAETFAATHGVLMTIGLGLMGVCHWHRHHHGRDHRS